MKKIFAFVLLVSSLLLTGCTKSAPTEDYIDEFLGRLEENENVVVVETEKAEGSYKEYKNSSTTKLSEEEETTYTFYEKLVKIERSSKEEASQGSNEESSKSYSTTIYDFETGFIYRSIGNDGKYEKSEMYTSSYESLYSSSISVRFLNDFMGDEFITEFEEEENGLTNFFKIYQTNNDNLTYTENYSGDFDEEYSYYYSGSVKYSYSYSITFKDSKVSIPSDSKLLAD